MNPPAEPIARHRTALRRSTQSSPLRHLLDFGFLDGSRTVFDYGCGQWNFETSRFRLSLMNSQTTEISPL